MSGGALLYCTRRLLLLPLCALHAAAAETLFFATSRAAGGDRQQRCGCLGRSMHVVAHAQLRPVAAPRSFRLRAKIRLCMSRRRAIYACVAKLKPLRRCAQASLWRQPSRLTRQSRSAESTRAASAPWLLRPQLWLPLAASARGRRGTQGEAQRNTS